LLTRRCISLRGGTVADVVGGLAEALGHTVAGPRQDEADLVLLEAESPDLLSTHRGLAPILVVVPRRLRDSERRAFLEAGAARVADSESSLLELAFMIEGLLFPTLRLQRRYARQFGGIGTWFWPTEGARRGKGSLVALSQAGAYLVTDEPLAEGTPITMAIGVAGRTIELRGRVTYVADSEDQKGFGVEFALEDPEVAPRLADLTGTHSNAPDRARALAQASL
jgi:hypothetical protein